jgi:uncharacterized protein YndB with AHSA1/START domain
LIGSSRGTITLRDVEIEKTVFETHVGGNIYDRCVHGSECRWARALAFKPPHRLLFSWDISPPWQLETDPEHTSEVEVRFTELGPSRTRVELEHRHLDRHGVGWEAGRDGIGSDGGWPLYLSRFAKVAAESRGATARREKSGSQGRGTDLRIIRIRQCGPRLTLRDDYSGEKHCQCDTESDEEQGRPQSSIQVQILAEYRDREVRANMVHR